VFLFKFAYDAWSDCMDECFRFTLLFWEIIIYSILLGEWGWEGSICVCASGRDDLYSVRLSSDGCHSTLARSQMR
jgi:hypothetical protein